MKGTITVKVTSSNPGTSTMADKVEFHFLVAPLLRSIPNGDFTHCHVRYSSLHEKKP